MNPNQYDPNQQVQPVQPQVQTSPPPQGPQDNSSTVNKVAAIISIVAAVISVGAVLIVVLVSG